MLIEKKEVKITGKDGIERTYYLGKYPYMPDGREICTQFISTAAPKIGDYKANEALSRKIFKYVAVKIGDNFQTLETDALINNHVPNDFFTPVKLEAASLEYNMGFSIAGKVQEFQQEWMKDLPALITKTLTQLAQSLQQKDSAQDTN